MIQNKKIVVLTEKFCDLNPCLGTTSAYSNVIGSLISAGIKDIRIRHYDEYLLRFQKSIDDTLIEEAKENKPDYVFCSYYPFMDSRNIKLDTFEKFRKMGVPVIFIWFDFGHAQIRNLALQVGSLVGKLNVVVDTIDQVNNENFISMWVPQDERLFHPTEKDIDACFVGTVNNYPTRRMYLDFIKSKFPLYVSGGQREHCLSIEDYATIIGRSRISLNFPDKSDGTVQAKCRIYESMLCGSLLLEKDNEAIKKWFDPMIHYVPFSNEQDLLDKINYYLEHPDERNAIVSTALNKMKTDYSSEKWWTTVLEKAK